MDGQNQPHGASGGGGACGGAGDGNRGAGDGKPGGGDGGHARGGEQQGDMVTTLYTTGLGYQQRVYFFPNWHRLWAWNVAVLNIKNQAAAIANGPENGRDNRWARWLRAVADFMADFGVDFVPIDIREAVSDVEQGLGRRNRTVWPPLPPQPPLAPEPPLPPQPPVPPE